MRVGMKTTNALPVSRKSMELKLPYLRPIGGGKHEE